MSLLSPPCLMQGVSQWQSDNALIISDLHLSADTRQANIAFEQLLSFAEQFDSICILGDLFEVYAGDDSLHEDAHVQHIAGLISKAANHTRIAVMHGNRDFLLGPLWFEQTHSQFMQDTCELSNGHLNQASYLLSHGDRWCTLDEGYQKAKLMIRNPAWQQQVLGLSYVQRCQIAKQTREQSMQAKTETQAVRDQYDVQDSAVELTLMQYKQQTSDEQVHSVHVIHGHTHAPRVHNLASYNRYVLGDWQFDTSYEHASPSLQAIVAVYQAGQMLLKRFDGHTITDL